MSDLTPYIRQIEKEFQDSYIEMYPEAISKTAQYEHKDERLAMATKNVTIVVTEGCSLACKYCVTGDTLITMGDCTTRPIRDVLVGDVVLGFDEFITNGCDRRQVMVTDVTEVMSRDAEVLRITLESGRHIDITEEHPILSRYGGNETFASAGETMPGDTACVIGIDSRSLDGEVVTSVEKLPGTVRVYNLETTLHTYFANGFAVHNCYQHAKNHNNVLDEETARQIVDLLFEEDASNNKYINEYIAQALVLDFIGGEPLLNVKIISYFMRYFKWKALQLNHRWAIHYMISISSNGIAYMNPEVQKFLMIHKGRVSITLTLDGNKALHDACRVFPDGSPSYDIVAKATRHAQSVFGLGKGTKLTLAPANIIHLSDAVKNLYESFDFDGVHANCVYEIGWEIEHAKIMYGEMKKLADWMLENEVQKHFYCSLFDPIIGKPQGIEDNQNYCGGLAGTMLAFTTQGNITPCLRYTQFNLNNAQPEIRMGDLETGIGNDPKYDAMIDVVNGITRRSQSTDECFNCPISTGCGWCSAYNYEIYGTPNKRCTSICPMHKARVMANVYFWNSLYRKYNLPDRFACNIPQEWALEIITKDEFDLLEALAEA